MNSFLNYQRKHLVLFKQQAMNKTFYKRISVTSSILKTIRVKYLQFEGEEMKNQNLAYLTCFKNVFSNTYIRSYIYFWQYLILFLNIQDTLTRTVFAKKKCVLSFFYELYCNIYEIDFYLCDGMLQAWFEK